MLRNITIVAGPCSVESREQIRAMAYKTRLIADVANDYGINVEFRAGAWKPRTKYFNGRGERNFEGLGEQGLILLHNVMKEFDLPIVTELMNPYDLKYFYKWLDPEVDTAQVGARTSQTFSMLAYIGLSPFNVLLKNPQHGVDDEEAIGSLERITSPSQDEVVITGFREITGREPDYHTNPGRRIVYCIRGEKPPKVKGAYAEVRRAYIEQRRKDSNEHLDARNFNNIGDIAVLRDDEYFKLHEIQIFYDPSHVFGGKNNQVRRKIGEHAVKAITEFDYDGLVIEVNDQSAYGLTDKDQALVTTFNGIDWEQTNMGQEPKPDEMPLSLVDIVKQLIANRVAKGIVAVDPAKLVRDYSALDRITWDMAA